MSRLRLKTRIKEDNLKKAQEEGHITQDQAEEVKRTEGRYNPYTDTYLNTDVLPEITVTAKAPKRTWTSEWSYNDPDFRLRQEHINISANDVAKSTRDKMNQVGNAIGKTIIEGTSFTPLWFAAPIAKSGIAASEGDYSGAAKEAAVGFLAPYAIGKGLEKGYRVYQTYKGWQNGLKEAVAEGLQNTMTPVQTNKYGTIKYYGPTMGKTTAVKTNPRLIDFDDIVREEIQQLANKKGISVRELKTKSDIEYTQLLENAVSKWQANPANKDKTLLISNSVLSNKPIFDNTPVIPSKNQFIARQIARGESDPTFAAQYYDDLLKRNSQLKIDDRFVSEIESGTRSAKISESELLGIPKGERNQPQIDFSNRFHPAYTGKEAEDIFKSLYDPNIDGYSFQLRNDVAKARQIYKLSDNISDDVIGNVLEQRWRKILQYPEELTVQEVPEEITQKFLGKTSQELKAMGDRYNRGAESDVIIDSDFAYKFTRPAGSVSTLRNQIAHIMGKNGIGDFMIPNQYLGMVQKNGKYYGVFKQPTVQKVIDYDNFSDYSGLLERIPGLKDGKYTINHAVWEDIRPENIGIDNMGQIRVFDPGFVTNKMWEPHTMNGKSIFANDFRNPVNWQNGGLYEKNGGKLFKLHKLIKKQI